MIELASHVGSLAMPRTPLYQRVVDDIRAQIADGRLNPGDQLPTARELQLKYGVGSTAVRNAMLILRSEGLIEGQQGKGVFVR